LVQKDPSAQGLASRWLVAMVRPSKDGRGIQNGFLLGSAALSTAGGKWSKEEPQLGAAVPRGGKVGGEKKDLRLDGGEAQPERKMGLKLNERGSSP